MKIIMTYHTYLFLNRMFWRVYKSSSSFSLLFHTRPWQILVLPSRVVLLVGASRVVLRTSSVHVVQIGRATSTHVAE